MSFDKAAYWKEKTAKKILKGVPHGSMTVACPRCQGTAGTLIKDYFFCSKNCDQNSFLNRVKGFFGFGNWRVVYPDGLRSEPMGRRVAGSYARMFKGQLLATKSPILNNQLR